MPGLDASAGSKGKGERRGEERGERKEGKRKKGREKIPSLCFKSPLAAFLADS